MPWWCQNKVPDIRLCSLCCGGGGAIIIYNQFALLGCTLAGPLAREAGSLECPKPRGVSELQLFHYTLSSVVRNLREFHTLPFLRSCNL